jgi:hypothetical protein
MLDNTGRGSHQNRRARRRQSHPLWLRALLSEFAGLHLVVVPPGAWECFPPSQAGGTCPLNTNHDNTITQEIKNHDRLQQQQPSRRRSLGRH